MIYLSEFYFPSQNSEANYLAESPRAKMTCYDSFYPFGLFASRGGTFSLNFTVLLVFWPKVWYYKRNVLLKGGYTQMGWNGCIFFKKGQI